PPACLGCCAPALRSSRMHPYRGTALRVCRGPVPASASSVRRSWLRRLGLVAEAPEFEDIDVVEIPLPSAGKPGRKQRPETDEGAVGKGHGRHDPQARMGLRKAEHPALPDRGVGLLL